MVSKVKKVLDDNNIQYSFNNLSEKNEKKYRILVNTFGYELNFIETDEGIVCCDGIVAMENVSDFKIEYLLNIIRYKNKHDTLKQGTITLKEDTASFLLEYVENHFSYDYTYNDIWS